MAILPVRSISILLMFTPAALAALMAFVTFCWRNVDGARDIAHPPNWFAKMLVGPGHKFFVVDGVRRVSTPTRRGKATGGYASIAKVRYANVDCWDSSNASNLFMCVRCHCDGSHGASGRHDADAGVSRDGDHQGHVVDGIRS
jgi:hypothetical protein